MAFTYKFYLKGSINALVYNSFIKAEFFALNTVTHPSKYKVDVFDNSGNLINEKARLKDIFDFPDEELIKHNIYKNIFPRNDKIVQNVQ